MGALYDAADIYLMSPNADNMPLSLLECFAAGLPIVSSTAGGIPNIVEDQTNGLLFRAQRSSSHGRLRAASARRAWTRGAIWRETPEPNATNTRGR